MIVKEKIINNFNKGADTYDIAAVVQAFIAKQLASYLPKKAVTTVLEVGCGTGLFSQYLFEHYSDAAVLLTDIAPSMLNVCQQRFKQYANASFVCVDGEYLNMQAGFDLIASSMVFHWFEDIKHSLQNMTRQLVPGGQLIFATLSENSLQEWRAICQRHDIEVAIPIFPSSNFIRQSCEGIDVVVETYQHTYSSLYAFLNSLKQLGAVTARWQYIPLSSGKMRKLMRLFTDELIISYEVTYGNYLRK